MLSRLYNWYGKRVVRSIALLIVVLIIAAFVFSGGSNQSENTNRADATLVKTAQISELIAATQIELIGTVEAVSEAVIQSEASGQVTRVNVSLGEMIGAGTILGELENKSERAQLLQAEGVYEAAVAAAAQSDVSVLDAETSLQTTRSQALNTYRNSYTVVDDVVSTVIDDAFANGDYGVIGFRLDGVGSATKLNAKRLSLRSIMSDWSSVLFTAEIIDAHNLLNEAKSDTLFVAQLLEDIAIAANDSDNDGRTLGGSSIEAYRAELVRARVSVNGALQAIEAALASIESAEEVLTRIRLAGTGDGISSANASVKQALGALRGAEANFEKTIFRTPISGTVNSLAIKTGDFVSAFNTVARVANNTSLLITAYLGDSERAYVSVGTPVRIDDRYDGMVSHISPAYDPETGKIEIKIETDTDVLQNGDTVTIALLPVIESDSIDVSIQLPLTAIKLRADDAFVFTVSDNILVAHQVMLGKVNGQQVEVIEGVDRTWSIVTDARGLIDGQKVTILE